MSPTPCRAPGCERLCDRETGGAWGLCGAHYRSAYRFGAESAEEALEIVSALTAPEAATVLGVHANTVRRMTRDGRLTGPVSRGGQRRVTRASLDAYMREWKA